MNKKLYLIRGASGSGKSSFVEAMMTNKDYAVAFSADDWMVKKGKYEYNKKRLPIVHKICLDQTEKAMNPVFNEELENYGGWEHIFIHNTFTTKSELTPYYKLAEKYNYDVYSVVVENRHEGKNTHGVTGESLAKQKERFQVQL